MNTKLKSLKTCLTVFPEYTALFMPTYLSKDALLHLQKELEHRIRIERREIAEKIAVAKELGDLKENFEYHEAKSQQSINEMRIMELEAMLKDTKIVEKISGTQIISLGCTFIVSVSGKEQTFQMVGSTEANPLEGKISNEAAVGKAFLGHRISEKVEVETPGGIKHYTIIQII